MKLTFCAVLVASVALGDIDFSNGGVRIGPVKTLNCAADGGLYCTRDAGSVGNIRCSGATATEPGCVTPSAQSFAGDKTLTGDLRVVGHVHASLTACDSSHKGNWQTCTTHNSPVFCDGTNNIETFGGSSAEVTLESIEVNGIPTPFFGAFTVSASSSVTITAVSGFWGIGAGAGSLPLTFLSNAGTCTCTIDCDNPGARTPCSGNCSIPTGTTVFALRGTTTCTLDPYVGGNLDVKGTTP